MPLQRFTQVPFNYTGMSFPDPTRSIPENWIDYCIFIVHLVSYLPVRMEFVSSDHALLLKELVSDIWSQNDPNSHQALAELTVKILATKACRLQRGKKTRACISFQTSMVNGAELEAQVFMDALFL